MSTLEAIAKRVGVSTATVSRSLSGSRQISLQVREMVLAEAQRQGYVQARKVEPVRPSSVGIAYANRASGPRFGGYDAEVWAGVARACASCGVSVQLVELDWRRPGEDWADWARRIGVGVLVMRVDADTHELAEPIAAAGVPVVVVADRYEHAQIAFTYCDSGAATRQAIDHLMSLGHRRIGLAHNPVLDADHADRIDAYQAALRAAGIADDPTLIIQAPADLEGGAAALTRFLCMPEPPTAVFFCDPPMTVGALRRALELSLKVPDDLSIVGVDDERLRRLTYPAYTAVCQDAAELAFQAGRWAVQKLTDTRQSPLQLRQQAFLEINQTTAPPPATPTRMTPAGQRL